MKNIKKFTIKRTKWLRNGDGLTQDSYLLDSSSGKMCCLGFYALACGLKKKDIKDEGTPSDVLAGAQKEIPNLLYRRNDNKICNQLMAINDNANTSDARKEKAIKNNFAKLGVEVDFVD